MTQQTEQAEAEQALRAGQEALATGRVERAAESLTSAESRFRQLGQPERAGEARLALAEVQRQNGAADQAQASYERAVAYFKDAGAPQREAEATLALGHIERQRGKIDAAWQQYFLALRLFEKVEDRRGQAGVSLALGHVERLRGRHSKAADYYRSARALSNQTGDGVSEADAARGQGEMLTADGDYAGAREALQYALAAYQQGRDRYGAIDALNSLGRLELEQAAPEVAAARFGDAIEAAGPVEYDLGAADGILGLAEVSLREGRLDQALASALKAGETYSASRAALGGADVNRTLGEVNLRRGQLAQSVNLFERSMRAYQSLKAQAPYLRAALGGAEANRRRALPRKAEDLFIEARGLAQESAQPVLEADAILGLGRIARARGENEQARGYLDDVERRFKALDRPARAAEATIERAGLALTHGRLDEAATLVARALRLAHKKDGSGARGPESQANTADAAISAALGQLDRARAHAHDALMMAGEAGDEQARLEALLMSAETELLAENLQAAVNLYNQVATLAQEREAVVVEVTAAVGLARILLRRGLAEEAAISLQEALPRLRAAGEMGGQTLTLVCLGEARRALNEREVARGAFADALRLARQLGDPLLEAQALTGQARMELDAEDPASASARYGEALALVERVGAGVKDGGDRATFFDAYAALAAEALIAAARAGEQGRAEEMTATYAANATKMGCAAAAQRLREEEQAIPTRGADLTPERLARNKEAVALLRAARKALTR